jgi:hypothetical protein
VIVHVTAGIELDDFAVAREPFVPRKTAITIACQFASENSLAQRVAGSGRALYSSIA